MSKGRTNPARYRPTVRQNGWMFRTSNSETLPPAFVEIFGFCRGDRSNWLRAFEHCVRGTAKLVPPEPG